MKNEKLNPSGTYNEEEKLTWQNEMEVKDLVKPIVLRRIRIAQVLTGFIIFSVIGFFVWRTFFQPPTGKELIAEMIKAAGGKESWNAISEGYFLRTHKLYDEKGTVIKQDQETFFFRNTNEGLQLMVRALNIDGDQVVVGKDDEGYWASQNGKSGDAREIATNMEYMCHADQCVPLCASEMALYRFSMPFKLDDQGMNSKYAGTTTLNGQKALMVDVTFDPKVGSDRWVFLIDPETKLIRKIEHYPSASGNEQPEEIYWSDFRKEGSVNIAHSNKYYRSNGKILEEYRISDVNFKPSFAINFFDRPLAMNVGTN